MNKTKLNIIIYLVRAVVLLLLGGYFIINFREWIFEWWGIQISQKTYSWISYFGICLIFIFAMPKLIKALRENHKGVMTPKIDKTITNITEEGDGKYYYSYLYLFVIGVLVVMSVCPVIIAAINIITGKVAMNIHIILQFCLIYLPFPVIVSIYLVYLLLYSVRVDQTSVTITVKGVSTKRFLLSEIVDVQVSRVRWLLIGTVKLVDDKNYKFDGMLKNFYILVGVFKKHCRLINQESGKIFK